MFEFEVILSMKNGDKIKYRETANNKEKLASYLSEKIWESNYIVLNEDVNGDCIWIKDTKNIQHVVIKEI